MNTKQPDEEVSVDELGKRYARIYALDLADGMPQRSPENHFCLSLLFQTQGQYSAIEGANGLKYRIPSWSNFTESAIAAREAANKS